MAYGRCSELSWGQVSGEEGNAAGVCCMMNRSRGRAIRSEEGACTYAHKGKKKGGRDREERRQKGVTPGTKEFHFAKTERHEYSQREMGRRRDGGIEGRGRGEVETKTTAPKLRLLLLLPPLGQLDSDIPPLWRMTRKTYLSY